MFYPLTFHPIFQERIWGGRKLESLYQKALPPGKIIGESWEISDRPEANSVVANGPLAGKTLAELLAADREAIMGRARTPDGKFPLLIKLLDAQDNLSLQVHPPAHRASDLGGCAKTEMWYVSAADPGALLYAGLKKGVTKNEFAEKTRTGAVAECFHQLPVGQGDSLFLPSGRVHALGKGLVIFEIQQNSDTTYRVFDWKRVDASGKSRQLHVEESLKCIDFEDFEPTLTSPDFINGTDGIRFRPLARHSLFSVDLIEIKKERFYREFNIGEPRIVGVVSGWVEILHEDAPVRLYPGQFALIPAVLMDLYLRTPEMDASIIVATPG
jgi:mannose-6-phosphate isomerase